MNTRFKRVLTISIVLSIVSLFVFVCCFYLIPTKYHKAFLLKQTDVVFQAENGSTVFSLRGSEYPRSYNFEKKNHFEMVLFEVDGNRMNCNQITSNEDYIFAALENGKAYNPTGYINVYDVDLDLIKTINFGEYNEVAGLVSNGNCLYYIIRNWKSSNSSLYKYYIESDKHILLKDDLNGANYYNDEDRHLFFDSLGKLHISREKTQLMLAHDSDGYYCMTDGIVSIKLKNKKLTIFDGTAKKVFDAKSCDLLYDKAYIIGDNLIFAAYRNVKKQNCATLQNEKGFCLCGMKESYLYCYDMKNMQLNVKQTFRTGTYLIDYDLNNVEYYYDGTLCINDTLVRKCETIEAKEFVLKPRLSLADTIPSIIYYLSFYNGAIYGI